MSTEKTARRKAGPWIIAGLIALMALPPMPMPAEGDEALDFFMEEAEVITASRRKQKLSESPVTIEVITAEQIKAMGVHDIWDVFRFALGVDVTKFNTPSDLRATLSVRGFKKEFQSSLQILMDGRSMVSPANGGVYWQEVPVQIADIERVEIVRGPNSALFGSNAGLGVINIITKRQEKGSGASFETGGLAGRNQLYRAHVQAQAYGARISVERGGVAEEPQIAGETDDLTYDNGIQFTKMNLGANWDLGENTNLDLSAGYHRDTRHVSVASFPGMSRPETHFQLVKLSHNISQNQRLELSLSRNDILRSSSDAHVREAVHDVELLDSLDLADGRLKTVLGASFRHASVDSPDIFNQGVNTDNAIRENRIVRGFLSQSFQLFDPVTLAWAFSGERSDTGDAQGAGQGSILVTPFENHLIRLTAARAPTVPTMYQAFPNFLRPHPTLPQGMLFVQNEGINPIYINNFEVGLGASYLNRRLKLDASLYYMELDGLVTTQVDMVMGSVSVPFPPFSITIPVGMEMTLINGNSAIARGVELSGAYTLAPGRSVFVNYTQEYITDTQGDTGTTNGTPTHKLNAGIFARLVGGFSTTVLASRYSGYEAESGSLRDSLYIEPYLRLDARLAWANDNLEIFAGGQNMLEERHREFLDETEIITQYYGGATLRFGGSQE